MTVNIDEIKQANPIESLVAEEFELLGRGKELIAREHDSLKVHIGYQRYFWHSMKPAHNWSGDVVEWVMMRKNMDFKSAVELLARRAGLPDPEWAAGEVEERLTAAARADAWTVATDVFHKWFLASPAAVAYAKGRGWTDETIRDHKLGFSGAYEDKARLREEMKQEFLAHGIDIESPAAVAVIGFSGNVSVWATRQKLTDQIKGYQKWIDRGYINGMIGFENLVYPHLYHTKTVYFSVRGLKEKTHFNLPGILAGDRKVFLNSKWSPTDGRCVIVEGQADAITLAQWGINAIALCGLSTDSNLKSYLKKDGTVFVALDNDEAGSKNVREICNTLYPLARVVRWPEDLFDDEGNPIHIKDGNDVLKAFIKMGTDHAQQVEIVRAMLINSISYLETAAKAVGEERDQTTRDANELEVIKLFIKLDKTKQEQYRQRVAKAMNRQLRDFDRIIKQISGKMDTGEDKNGPEKVVATYGGFFHGWLIEYLYDPETETAALAYRDPQGNIGKSSYIDIMVNGEKHRYVPEEVYKFITSGGITFPSDLGEKKTQRELVAMLTALLKSIYLFDDDTIARIIAYYVLMTWLYDMFAAIPYLRALGPSGCGKSQLMKRVGKLCYRPTKSSGNDTAATLWRTIEMFGGTLIVEEYDQASSDTTDPFIKVLNSGAMRDGQSNRMTEYTSSADGSKGLRPEGFSVFCPKLLDGRMDTKDDAVGSRCITFRVQPHETIELIRANIPIHVGEDYLKKTLKMQNLLLRYRLETWQEKVEPKNSDYDMEISPRMNEITVALKIIARLSDDQTLIDELTTLLRDLDAQDKLGRAETMDARIIEATWKIFLYPKYHIRHVTEVNGQLCMYPKHIAKVVNEIIDKMNSDVADKKKNQADEVSANSIGRILGGKLGIKKVARRADGVLYAWQEDKMISLAMRNGVDWKKVCATILERYARSEIPPVVLDLAERYEINPKDYHDFEDLLEDEPEDEDDEEKQEKSVEHGQESLLT